MDDSGRDTGQAHAQAAALLSLLTPWHHTLTATFVNDETSYALAEGNPVSIEYTLFLYKNNFIRTRASDFSENENS